MARNKIKFLICLLLVAMPSFVFANPEGEVVVSGQATFDRSTPDTLNINTTSDKLIVNYNSFSIAQHETTNFHQPSANSVALNRVVGADPSQIFGTLTATGRIFIVNPNGVIFGPNSHVDAAGLVASTMDISNSDFLNGNYNFYKNGKNSYVINQSRDFIIRNGGYVALLSQAVDNQGVIIADLGKVVLASGTKMTLALDDLNDISVTIDEGVSEAVFGPDGNKIDSAVKNSGEIYANGGKVILTAKVLNNVFDYAINNTGIIEANALANHNGVVELVADGAPILNIGKIEAGQINIRALNTDFINKGQVISPKIEGLPGSGLIYIKTINLTQDGLIAAIGGTVTIEAETIKTTMAVAPGTDPASLALLVIRANQVNILSKSVGRSGFPIAIDASNIYFNRTAGNIDILESIGIGSSILLRGPPDGFGEIIYNRDANLELDAAKVTLVGSNPTYLYGNITFHNFECTTPDKEIYFEAGHTYTFKGTFNVQGAPDEGAEEFLIKLRSSQPGSYWYLDLQSQNYTFDLANVQDAYALSHIFVPVGVNAGHNVNVEIDPVWDGGATGLNNTKWSLANNWVGNVLPTGTDEVRFNGTSTKNCTIDNVGSWSGGRFVIEVGYTGTITQNVNIAVGNFEQAGGTFKTYKNLLQSYTLTIGGNFTKTGGTFDNTYGNVIFNSADLNNTITSSGTTFRNLTFTGGGAWKLLDNLTVSVGLFPTLNIDNGNLIANGNDISVSGGLLPSFTIGTNGILTLQGDETITVPALFKLSIGNNGTVVYTGNGNSASDTYNINSWIYKNLTIDSIDANDTFRLPTANSIVTGNFSLINGEFTTKDSTNQDRNLNVSGNVGISLGATFYANSSTITVGGNWTNSGIFYAGSSTVTFNGGSGVTQELTSGGSHFYNIIHSGAGTLDLLSDLYLEHNFTNSNGNFNLGDHELYVEDNLTISGGTLTQGSKEVNAAYLILQSGGTFNQGSGLVDINYFIQSGGTFNGNSGDINIENDFTLSGGTFTSTFGTLSIEGDWTHTAGGTFNHNNGTVVFDGGDANINVATSETFKHLTFNSTGTKTIANNDTLIVTGTLTLTNGIINTGTLEAQGNVVVGSSFDGGSSPLRFTGSAAQTFNLTGATNLFNGNITIAKTAGTVTLLSDLDMDETGQDLTVTSGTLNLGNYMLFIEDTLTINGGTLIHGSSELNSSYLRLQSGTLTQGSGEIDTNYFIQSGGTFNGGSGEIEIDNDFALLGGDFTSTSGTLSIKGNWTKTGGTFTPGTGTVNFIGGLGVTQTLTSGGESFYNLIHSGAETLQLQDALDVNGTFTNSVGTFDANNQNMNFAGNWNNTGSAIFTRGTGALTFDGTTTLTNSSSNAASLGAVTIPGTVTLGSNATMASNTGAGTLNLGAGGYTLTLTGTGSPLGVANFDKGTNSTVDFNGSGSQTMPAFNYNNLTSSSTGARTLASSGTIGIAGTFAPGGNTYTVIGSTINFNGSGAQTIPVFTYNNLTTSTGGTKTLGGDVTVGGNLTVGNGTDLDGAHNLNVTGNAVFDGTVGAGIPLTSLYVSGTSEINGGAVTTDGTQTYTGAATLGADATLTGANVYFGNTVDSLNTTHRSLTVNSTGITRFVGAVGVTQALSSLTTNVAGTTEINGGAVTTDGDQIYGDAVTLGANTTLTGTNINFMSTLNLNSATTRRSLTVNASGLTLFNGVVGGVRSLSSITTDAFGTTQINDNITTTGGQRYNDDVILSNNVILTASNASANIRFSKTLNSDALGTPRNLTVNTSGTTRFDGIVGGVCPLASITTNAAGTTRINANITTTGGQTYNDAVVLSHNVTLTGTDIQFISTLDSFNATPRSLTVNDSGTTIFGGIVGGTNPLLSLTTDAAGFTQINGGAVTTTTFQTYNDPVTLGVGTTALTSTSGALIKFGNKVDGNCALTINGAAEFNNQVGSGTALASLLVSGASNIKTDLIRTAGTQEYQGAVTLGDDATLTTTNNGNIIFQNLVNGIHNLILSANGTGDITFNGAVNIGTLRINTVDDVNFNANVTTAGDITQVTGTGTTTINNGFMMDAGGNINITTGAIQFLGTGRMRSAAAVILSALTGGITSGTAARDITADKLTFSAAGSVGASDNPLTTDVNEIVSGTSTTGDIYIDEKDGAIFRLLTALAAGKVINIVAGGSSTAGHIEADGRVTIELTDGDLTILSGTVQSNNSGVTIILDNGSLYADAAGGPHIIAHGTSYITVPHGTITATGPTLSVEIYGNLILDIGAKVNGTSGRLNGYVAGGGLRIPLFVPSRYPSPLYPPGKVFYNGRMIWPSIFTYIFSQAYQALNNNPYFPDSEQFRIYQYNSADTRLVFFYHPLTEYDMAAFDQFILEEGAYEFINGQINILGHDGLLPILEEIKKRKKNTTT